MLGVEGMAVEGMAVVDPEEEGMSSRSVVRENMSLPWTYWPSGPGFKSRFWMSVARSVGREERGRGGWGELVGGMGEQAGGMGREKREGMGKKEGIEMMGRMIDTYCGRRCRGQVRRLRGR